MAERVVVVISCDAFEVEDGIRLTVEQILMQVKPLFKGRTNPYVWVALRESADEVLQIIGDPHGQAQV